jgi:hypothetical protein
MQASSVWIRDRLRGVSSWSIHGESPWILHLHLSIDFHETPPPWI